MFSVQIKKARKSKICRLLLSILNTKPTRYYFKIKHVLNGRHFKNACHLFLVLLNDQFPCG